MASQVLSGTGNVSYTNNTGQNVRVVINFMSSTQGIFMGWGSNPNTTNASTANIGQISIGRNLAFNSGFLVGGSGAGVAMSSNNMTIFSTSGIAVDPATLEAALPTEIMLSPSQVFSVRGNNPNLAGGGSIASYNIVVIPEGG